MILNIKYIGIMHENPRKYFNNVPKIKFDIKKYNNRLTYKKPCATIQTTKTTYQQWGDQGFKTKVTEDVVSEIMLELEDEAPVAVEFFGQKLIIQKMHSFIKKRRRSFRSLFVKYIF